MIKISRILNEITAESVGEMLYERVDETPRVLILSFEKVEYVTTQFFAKLLILQKRLRTNGKILIICSVKPEIYETFEITKLNKVFTIVDNLESAFQELGAR